MEDYVNNFNSELLEEVHNFSNENSIGTESAFTSVFISYLTEHEETNVANAHITYCSNDKEKIKVNAFAYNEYFQSLTLVVSCFNNRETIEKINKTDCTKFCKKALKFFRLCCGSSEILSEFEESSDIYQLYEFILGIKENIDNVSIVFLTNKLASNEIPDDTVVNKYRIKYDIWDIERLAQIVYRKRENQKLRIRFKNKYKYPLKLIKVPQESDIYDCYVGYISGNCLAAIYKDEGQKLIEKNVRSFLQATGKVNKGIKDTLKNNSSMFMAYNNGISTIAEEIEIDEEKSNDEIITVKELVGWQIVNGGQTTASLYNAMQNKVLLDNVNVQMKLAVIKNPECMDEVVSSISKYANSQNKITMSDFSANDDFHVQLERLSRKIYIPVEKGKPVQRWFYERARGQYLVEVNRQRTPSEKKKYKEQNPKNKCISKTVAAKCIMCWLKYPHIVSKGLETNFIKYSEMIQEQKIGIPDDQFFCDLISQVILFKDCDKIVDEQNFGGYKAQINYYTIALLSEFYSNLVDFKYIWQHQRISPETALKIQELCYKVWNHFDNPYTNGARGVNVTQWCKHEECWELLKKRYLDDTI